MEKWGWTDPETNISETYFSLIILHINPSMTTLEIVCLDLFNNLRKMNLLNATSAKYVDDIMSMIKYSKTSSTK